MGTFIILIIILGVIIGPLFAWSAQSAQQQRAHETRRAKFEAGQGKDPDKALMGPHKSFRSNALIGGVVLATAFGIFFLIGLPLGAWLAGVVFGSGSS